MATKFNLENVRLHRGDNVTFYWDITTNKKVDENLIPVRSFIPEQQRV